MKKVALAFTIIIIGLLILGSSIINVNLLAYTKAEEKTFKTNSSTSSLSYPLQTISINPFPNSWTPKARMNEARFGLKVAVVKGRIYAIGGSTLASRDGIVGKNEEYDPETNLWRSKKPMLTPREYFGIAVYSNKIYCIGGESSSGLTAVNEVYDPATNTWETKVSMPTPRAVQAHVVNGKIYLIGDSHNEVYDPVEDTWETKASMLPGACSYPAAVFGEKIYVHDQIYNTKNDSWSYGTPIGKGYGFAAAGVTTGLMAPKRIYVFESLPGPKSGPFSGIPYYICPVRSYDPENDGLINHTYIPTERSSFAIAVIDDTFYVIGGITFDSERPSYKIYTTNEQYTPFGYGNPDPSYTPPAPTYTPSSPEPTPTAPPEPFPTTIAVASIVIIAVSGIGLLVYFKKYKK